MDPGTMIIRKCSECAQLIKEFTFDGYNLYDARHWTDGKTNERRMFLLGEPRLVDCPHCHALLWLNEQQEIGEIECVSKGEEYEDAPYFEELTAAGYFEILKRDLTDKAKVRYLRLRAWWFGNDERRESQEKIPLSEDEVSNLQALAELLDEADSSDRLKKAEIMRELGRFEEASHLLAGDFEEGYSQAVSLIGALVEKKDTFVAEMIFED